MTTIRIHSRRLFAAAALAFAPLLPGISASAANNKYTTFTDDGVWCWFSDPRAIYRNGKIYAGWLTSDGSVEVGKMDPATGEVQKVMIAPKFERDDHDNPALLFLPDGRLAIFYSKHTKSTGDMHLRITTKPEDIGEWTPDRELGFLGGGQAGVTYANPAMLSGEDNAIYLFWRGSTWKPTFSVSKDLGQTWSPQQTMISRPGAGGGNRPYLKSWNDGKGRINFVFTDGHPRNEKENSVYFLRYEKGAFYKADGKLVGTMKDLPIDPAKCDRVYDGSTGGRGWIWDIAEQDGRPAIAYTRLPKETDHRYHYARWDGRKWQDSKVADGGKWFPQTPPGKGESEPHYSAGMAIDPKSLDTLYLASPLKGIFEIGKWRTPDNGRSWKQEPVTQNSDHANIRPFVIRDAPQGAPNVMWMNLSGHYTHYTEYLTSLRINRPDDSPPPPALSDAIEPEAVLNVMRRVGDWQLDHPSRLRLDDWVPAVGYTGMMALADTSGDAKYYNAMRAIGEANDWKCGPKKYFADDYCIGQTYAELYLKEKDPKMIAKLRTQFDEILAAPKEGDLNIREKGSLDKWTWCDALFMGPPAWIRLWAATGDKRYLDFAVENWWKTSDYLYNKSERLYFRDSSYFKKREKNGKEVYWARGNGWVIAGHVRMLQFLPKDHPARPRFEQEFKEMAARLVSLQQSDGMWRSSLLDPDNYPSKETSGTALISYGLAWGMNNGLLDPKKFGLPTAKAWRAMVACVSPNGRLTHVQPVGADPQRFDPNSTDAFGVGAFLLAGSEMHRLGKDRASR